MFAYANIAKKDLESEIGGLLIVEELPEGGLSIEDILLPKQTVSGGSFKPEPGIKCDNIAEILPKIKGWWHSHGTMGTFHSSTDNDTLGDKWNGETKNSAPYALSVVVSLPNEIKAYLQYFKPYKLEKVEIPIQVVYPVSDEIVLQCKADVKERVTKQGGYYQKGFEWDHKLQKWVSPEEVRSELPDYSEKKGSVVEKIGTAIDIEGRMTDAELEEEAKWCIVDPTTSMTVAEMESLGMYHPEADDADLARQVECMKRVLREDEEATIDAISPPPTIPNKDGNLHYGQCPHISFNAQKREICIFQGKIYDCAKCERLHLMQKLDAEQKPANVPIETPKEESQPKS